MPRRLGTPGRDPAKDGNTPRPLRALAPEEEERLAALFRERLRPVEPLPPPPLPEPFLSLTGLPLPSRPRAIILDVYGTLLVSGAGEVGTAPEASGGSLNGLREALAEFGVSLAPDVFELALREEVESAHAAAKALGIQYPEVDAASIFSRVSGIPPSQARMLGAAREAALNPAFRMPGAAELLTSARGAGLALGIVSNAQYYTPPLLEASFGMNLAELGFEEDLCVWSWRLGRAKPDVELFRRLARALGARGIPADAAVYVGNDLLNDIAPAQAEGFKTALFAGDGRSLRLRRGDARTAGVVPDTVLSSLADAARLFRLGGS